MRARTKWTERDIADQSGRVVIVSGANSGIGFETARALGCKGATVILACRTAEKGAEAVARIEAGAPSGKLEAKLLDLGRLASIQAFAEEILRERSRLDLLICNAGVMMPPKRSQTADGFELQFGTNHLGHFALVGRLLPLLLATPGSRIVVVSSTGHRMGDFDFDDLQWVRRRYDRWKSYGQSKLANLLFAYELQRMLEAAGAGTIVAAAHPGWSSTNLQKDTSFFRWLNPIMGMKPRQGALPSLFAATAPEVRGGDYFGPDGFGEMRGHPTKVASSERSHDRALATKLWQVSEQLTGVRYPIGREVASRVA